MIVSQKGYIEIVKELIERGADLNAKNNLKRRRYKEIQHLYMQVEMDI